MPPLFFWHRNSNVLVENVQKGKKAWCDQVSKEKGPVVDV